MGAAATTTWVRDCGTRGHRTNRASATGRQRGGLLCKDIWRAPRGGWQRNIFEYILYYIFAGRSACHGDTHRVDDHDLDLREAGPTAAAEGGKSKGRGGGKQKFQLIFHRAPTTLGARPSPHQKMCAAMRPHVATRRVPTDAVSTAWKSGAGDGKAPCRS